MEKKKEIRRVIERERKKAKERRKRSLTDRSPVVVIGILMWLKTMAATQFINPLF